MGLRKETENTRQAGDGGPGNGFPLRKIGRNISGSKQNPLLLYIPVRVEVSRDFQEVSRPLTGLEVNVDGFQRGEPKPVGGGEQPGVGKLPRLMSQTEETPTLLAKKTNLSIIFVRNTSVKEGRGHPLSECIMLKIFIFTSS
jgi:hypothetical protein